MPIIDFPDLLKKLTDGVTSLAKQQLKTYADEALSDGYDLLQELKNNLQLWTRQLANGEISKDDFAYNLASAGDLLDMAALKQAGLAQIRVDEFKTAVLNLIVNTVATVIP